MDALIIEQTDDTPTVHLDLAGGKFEFSGKSLPEDVTTFYEPVFNWLKQYEDEADGENTFDFKMTYFNTASSKIILDILMRLEEISEGGKKINIAWYYEEDDEDMQEAGEEYSEIVEEISFKFIEMED